MVRSLEGKRHDYYEGILQLRDVDEEFVENVITQIENSKKAQISKVQPERNGVDIYLSDQHFTQSYAKSLKARFGGEVISSKKLFGRYKATGHVVYRVTVLFRKLPFNVGDVITTDEGDVKVVGMDTKVRVQNIKTGKKQQLRFDQLSRFVK